MVSALVGTISLPDYSETAKTSVKALSTPVLLF